jgi:hypothetical protein
MALEDVDNIVKAIAKIESNGVKNALGDGGQALGAYQFHPAAFFKWALQPTLNCTWDDWFNATICRFLRLLCVKFPDMPPTEAAVVYHRHCYIRRADTADYIIDDYSKRFQAAYAAIVTPTNKP